MQKFKAMVKESSLLAGLLLVVGAVIFVIFWQASLRGVSSSVQSAEECANEFWENAVVVENGLIKRPEGFYITGKHSGSLLAGPFDKIKVWEFESDDGIARYEKDGLTGYVSSWGQTITPAIYVHTSEFEDGIAYVETEDGDKFIIDMSGEAINALSEEYT